MSDPFPVDNPADQLQARAHAALGRVADQALTDFGWTAIRNTVFGRVQLAHLTQAVEYLAHAHHQLAPGPTVFVRTPLTSALLRAMTDVYARHLDFARSPNPETRIGALVGDSLRQERLAFDAAGKAGADVSEALKAIDQQAIGLPPAAGANVANTLEAAGEFQMLTVYRFESAHVHSGEAARRARTRALARSRGVTMEVHLEPPSLWRVGQLTWAVLGVWRRLASFLSAELALVPAVLQLSVDVEPDVRAAARRTRRDAEPLSPPYHEFDFPLWPTDSAIPPERLGT